MLPTVQAAFLEQNNSSASAFRKGTKYHDSVPLMVCWMWLWMSVAWLEKKVKIPCPMDLLRLKEENKFLRMIPKRYVPVESWKNAVQ